MGAGRDLILGWRRLETSKVIPADMDKAQERSRSPSLTRFGLFCVKVEDWIWLLRSHPIPKTFLADSVKSSKMLILCFVKHSSVSAVLQL